MSGESAAAAVDPIDHASDVEGALARRLRPRSESAARALQAAGRARQRDEDVAELRAELADRFGPLPRAGGGSSSTSSGSAWPRARLGRRAGGGAGRAGAAHLRAVDPGRPRSGCSRRSAASRGRLKMRSGVHGGSADPDRGPGPRCATLVRGVLEELAADEPARAPRAGCLAARRLAARRLLPSRAGSRSSARSRPAGAGAAATAPTSRPPSRAHAVTPARERRHRRRRAWSDRVICRRQQRRHHPGRAARGERRLPRTRTRQRAGPPTSELALRDRLLQRLIENRLQLQEAEREKIVVEDAELAEELAERHEEADGVQGRGRVRAGCSRAQGVTLESRQEAAARPAHGAKRASAAR